HLVTKYDCNVLILGCTELPLIFHECEDFACGGKTVEIVDPTATLARKAVEVAMATNKERGTR
ncbi:MAG: aspartate/glutamate racemase family protein, partial [Burkholderiaceae bacterium]|nr:aspartate/glutamate racemase family protein [Burkholderiaceae bacterium]